MNWSDITTIGTFIIAAVALYYAVKKQPHEEQNLDSQTIANLIKSVKEQTDHYTALEAKFETYKAQAEKYRQDTENELSALREEVKTIRTANTALSKENSKLRTWVEHLCEQLRSAKIEPVSE